MSRAASAEFSEEPLEVKSELEYPFTIEDAIRPTVDEDGWTLAATKSRKKRHVEQEPLPHAPAVVSATQPPPVEAIDALLQKTQRATQRRDRKHARKERVRAALSANTKRFTTGTARKMEHGRYVVPLEESLVNFFRSGYMQNFAPRDANGDVIPVHDRDILTFIQATLKKYKILISGGYILKYVKLAMDDLAKPSVDVDMYVPYGIPNRYPDFYKVMAKLFDCDRVKGSDGLMHNDVSKYVTQENDVGTKATFFKKNGIFSVFKHRRNVDGLYAEMDLVRASTARTAENIIRNFDLSVCMNWYDGEHLYSMDPEAILRPATVPGRLSFGYVPIFLGIAGTPAMALTCKGRLLKYIMRGYRMEYVNPRSGEKTEIVADDLPNAIENLIAHTNHNKRNALYARFPAVRRNIPSPTIKKKKAKPVVVSKKEFPSIAQASLN
jgi:hypothetical protein